MTDTIGRKHFTSIKTGDTPDNAGVNHFYFVTSTNEDQNGDTNCFGSVKFQKGPITDSGINGIFMEDLIAILIHRLRAFQQGGYASRENALALTKLKETLYWLNYKHESAIQQNWQAVKLTSEKTADVSTV